MMKSPSRFFALASLLVLLAGWGALRIFAPSVGALWAWVIAVNAVTFMVFFYDKAVAGGRRTRVPERILLALTAAGGTGGALAGMNLFHHKTVKKGFRRAFWAVVVLQIVGLAVYILYFAPRGAGGLP
jgi:uncharacterized membrane protein YsdA (DUF1294 family)